MWDFLDKLACRYLIWSLQRGYNRCHDYEDDCVSCKAREAVRFLKNHIELINWK